MNDIELVIKISENDLQSIGKKVFTVGEMFETTQGRIYCAIVKGTQLPKGHGRLIDADAFIAMMEDASKRQNYKKLLIDDCLTVDDVFKAIIESLLNKGLAEVDAPTIIKADNAESEE